MKILRLLDGSYASRVELVEIGGKEYALKTTTPEGVANERFFYRALRERGLPCLEVIESGKIKPNQILLEYIEGSPTLFGKKDPEMFRKWGKAARDIHSITFPSSFTLNEKGERISLRWKEFLERTLAYAAQRQEERKTDISAEFVARASALVRILLEDAERESFALLHGDLHANNAFLRNGGVILFDKEPTIAAGDPLYDLALLGIDFPNGLYIATNDPERENDAMVRAAFIEGYGEDFIAQDERRYDGYVLLRGLERYPNPFEKNTKEIIGRLARKYR